jgi:hypothetical protein
MPRAERHSEILDESERFSISHLPSSFQHWECDATSPVIARDFYYLCLFVPFCGEQIAAFTRSSVKPQFLNTIAILLASDPSQQSHGVQK